MRSSTIIRDIMAAQPDAVAQYRAGKAASFGFLVGQVMKATAGKASPRLVNELLRREIERVTSRWRVGRGRPRGWSIACR